MASAGVNWTPSPVGDSVDTVGLTRDERTQYQTIVDAATERIITKLSTDKTWKKMSPLEKQQDLDNLIRGIRDDAGQQVLKTIPDAEQKKRIGVGRQYQMAGATR